MCGQGQKVDKTGNLVILFFAEVSTCLKPDEF